MTPLASGLLKIILTLSEAEQEQLFIKFYATQPELTREIWKTRLPFGRKIDIKSDTPDLRGWSISKSLGNSTFEIVKDGMFSFCNLKEARDLKWVSEL